MLFCVLVVDADVAGLFDVMVVLVMVILVVVGCVVVFSLVSTTLDVLTPYITVMF